MSTRPGGSLCVILTLIRPEPRFRIGRLVDRINMSGQEPVQPPFRLGRRRRLGSCPFPGYSSISNIYQAKNDGNEQSGCSCASIPLGKFIRYACPIFLYLRIIFIDPTGQIPPFIRRDLTSDFALWAVIVPWDKVR